MEAPKCWCCKGPMEFKHYPVEICPACKKAGGGVERRDLFKRIDQKDGVDPKEEVIKKIETLLSEFRKMS